MNFKAAFVSGLLVSGAIAYFNYRNRYLIKDLKGKVVLVTGGSRGLGLVMATQLLEKGAFVIICSEDESDLIEASIKLSSISEDYKTICCDLRDRESIKSMFSEIKSMGKEVEIVINNAGIMTVGPMEAMSEEDYRAAMDVHFWGAYYVVKEALPGMLRRRGGRIVNIVSINGKISFPHLLPYTVSKHALSGYSEGIAAELEKYNILVTSVYPGLMRTGSPRNVDVKGKHKSEYSWFKISGSLPFLSVNDERAARKIIKAMRYGEKSLVIGVSAKMALSIEGFAHELNHTLFAKANDYLPSNADGVGKKKKKGYESKSDLSESIVAAMSDKAAEKNNEI